MQQVFDDVDVGYFAVHMSRRRGTIVTCTRLTFASSTAWIEAESNVADTREAADRVATRHVGLGRTPTGHSALVDIYSMSYRVAWLNG